MGQDSQQVTFQEKDSYLMVTLPPYESLKSAESNVSVMYDAVDRLNASKLLIDCRATHKLVPIMELYELCIYLVSKFGPIYTKMAVLASPEAVYPDRFFENVARNRGLDLIRFVDNEQEALAWLLGSKPGLPRK